MLGAVALLMGAAQRLRVLAGRARILHPVGRVDLVGLVPSERILLQALYHGGQGVAELVARPPAEPAFRPVDTERVVVARHSRHERANERLFALVDRVGDEGFGLVLHPSADRGDGRGDADRRPFLLAVDQLT